jgi:ParB-like chromosome segregation protein Spo0J
MSIAEAEAVEYVENDNLEMVDIDDIIIPKRHRELNKERAEVLAESIKETGLTHPIALTDEYVLVAGRHRIEAFRILGRVQIPATVKVFTDIDAEIAEIDENLIRYNLSKMESAEHLIRRKTLYNKKWNIKDGKPTPVVSLDELANADGSLVPAAGTTDSSAQSAIEQYYSSDEDGNSSSNGGGVKIPSFVLDAANKTGRSTTAVRDETNLGKMLDEKLSDEVKDLIRPTKAADNKRDLVRLMNEEDDEMQLEVAKRIRAAYDEDPNSNFGVLDAIKEIRGNNTLEATEKSSSDNGEASFLVSLTRVERLLSTSVESKDFATIIGLWTEEGLMNIRDRLLNIRATCETATNKVSEQLEK